MFPEIMHRVIVAAVLLELTAASVSPTDPRPSASAFLGHPQLAGARGIEYNIPNRTMRLDWRFVDEDGHNTSLHFHGQLKLPEHGNVLFLDHHHTNPLRTNEAASVQSVECARHYIQLTTYNHSDTFGLAEFLHDGALIAGGRHWKCAREDGQGVRGILHRVMGAEIVGERTVRVKIEREAHISEFVRSGKIQFSTSRYERSSIIQHTQEQPIVQPVGRQLQHVSRVLGFFSWVADTWNKIVDFGEKVAKVIETAAKIIAGLVTGDVSTKGDQDVATKAWAWNLEADHVSVKDNNTEIDADVSCTDCYALVSVTLHVNIDIENYQLILAETYVEGEAQMAGGSPHLTGSAKTSFDRIITTVNVGSFSFDALIPIHVDITMPVHAGYEFSSTFSGSAGAQFELKGSIKQGASLSCSSNAQSAADCTLRPISYNSFSKSASFDSLDYNTDVDLTLYIMPVVLVRLEYIGGPSFGFKPFIEVAADVASQYECDPHVANPPSFQLAPLGVEALKVTVNLGLQITIGAEIKVSFSATGHGIYNKSFPSTPVFSKKFAIATGCLSSDMGLDTTPAKGSSIASVRLPGSLSWSQNIPLRNNGLVPGTIWHGTIKNTCGDAGIPALQELVLQLTKLECFPGGCANGGTAYLGGSSVFPLAEGGACAFQSSFKIGLDYE